MADSETAVHEPGAGRLLGVDAGAVAGGLLFAVGGVSPLGIITAEVLYPGYTTLQEISDIGASRPPNSVVREPAGVG